MDVTNLVKSLRKIPQFYLISWCGNFAERYSFLRVLGDSSKTMWSCAFPRNFHTTKLGEILVFYAVIDLPLNDLICFDYQNLVVEFNSFVSFLI